VNVKEAAPLTGKLSGLAISGTAGESVRCVAEGTVVSAGPYRGFGRVAIVQTADLYIYVYGGCESLSVREGDKVKAGAELGKLGAAAMSGSPELYFMVYKNNKPVDPEKAPRT
jgi:septal ring factor EnvC (AmiA/AmiB activator)